MNIFLWEFVGRIFVELPVWLWHHHHLVLILVVVAPSAAAVLDFFFKKNHIYSHFMAIFVSCVFLYLVVYFYPPFVREFVHPIQVGVDVLDQLQKGEKISILHT